MCARRSPAARHSPASRSKVSNGSAVHQNVDERSAGARRFRDLVAAFSDEIGGELSESERSLVRQSAALTLRCEQLQEAIVRGDEIDDDLLVRISGTGKRLLSAIAVRSSGKKPATQTLNEYLAAKHAATIQPDDDEGE
jgi:hypothetical protein